jgi:bacterioferritin-associated ferredoxin
MPKGEGKVIICRCEDITLDEIRKVISKGYGTVEEIKRLTRAGMGQCQGRICTGLVSREIVKASGKARDTVRPFTCRPPAKPVRLGVFGRMIDE